MVWYSSQSEVLLHSVVDWDPFYSQLTTLTRREGEGEGNRREEREEGREGGEGRGGREGRGGEGGNEERRERGRMERRGGTEL